MQLALFDSPGSQALCFDRAVRIPLGAEAWVDFVPACVAKHQSLFEQLARSPIWTRERTRMYERTLDVPRLLGSPTPEMESADWVRRAQQLLSVRYGRNLCAVSLAHYRDGRDSVAMHADKVGALRDDTVIAIVSLGYPRAFLLKPAAGGPSRRFRLGHGDLLVMGGSCQRDWLHGVPKCKRASQRISVMFREAVPVAGATGVTGGAVTGAVVPGHGSAAQRLPVSNAPLRRSPAPQPSKRVARFCPS